MKDITIIVTAKKVAVMARTDAGNAWLRRRAMTLSLHPDHVANLVNEIQLAGLSIDIDRR